MTPTAKAILCYVTERNALAVPADTGRDAVLLERIRGAASAGVDWIELREKDLDSRTLLNLTRAVIAATRLANGASPLVLINDRLDVALAAGADGVHLAETSMPVGVVSQWKRQAKRADFLVGASCHSRESAQLAARDGADYIFFGPVFATPSKAAFGPPQGLPKLSEICRAVSIPVLAVGGINPDNAAACMEAGAAGIAAIGLFQRAVDPVTVLTTLRRRLAEGG